MNTYPMVIHKIKKSAAVAEFVLPAQLASGAILAISDEPLGGSPTGQPTGDVLAAGALTPV